PHAVTPGVAGDIGLHEPATRLRRPAPHPGWRTSSHHTNRPGRAGRRYRGNSDRPGWREILSAHPRLPGPFPPRLADAQAEGDTPGSGRVAAGRSRRRLECSPREPATALAAAMAPDQMADREEKLDATAAEDDGEGGPCSYHSRRRCAAVGWNACNRRLV